ncbi:protein of unknown function DUF1566 [Candidatus Magnetoovum chiemensis]|nr:protein of unknown function DUF1566 [Candidatus Magnetoovum chiemensis]
MYSGLVRKEDALAAIVELPKTGQTTCWDTNGTEIGCAGTAQDGEMQGGVDWPSQRFSITYCDASAPCSDQSADCDSDSTTDVVTDNLTGLMWPRNGNHGTMVWNSAIDYASSYTLCGYDDWHLPNVNELESLINWENGAYSTWLNDQGFVNGQNAHYWTATTYAGNLSEALNVYLFHSSIANYIKSSYFYAWPVRDVQTELWQTGQTISYRTGDDGYVWAGVEWPEPRFTDNNDGTVTDNLTGLMWLNDANCFGSMIWQPALDTVSDFNSNPNNYNCFGYNGSYSDWRLPNIKELRSLVDYSNYGPALPTGHPFVNVQ